MSHHWIRSEGWNPMMARFMKETNERNVSMLIILLYCHLSIKKSLQSNAVVETYSQHLLECR